MNSSDDPPPARDDRLGLPRVDKGRILDGLFGASSEPAFPPTLGRFQIHGRLGRGGMGTVFEAYDETLDRRVAIKLLHHGGAARRHQQRLQREAQALARLSHPHVVQVFETGQADGHLFIAMELAAGQTLAQWQREAHDWRTCLRVYQQAGRGLAAAHAQGIVHRDFKPANCIIDEGQRVKVLDFGLARGVDETLPSDSGPIEHASDPGALAQKLTQTGTMLGTPAYMAPEQLRRRSADARSDQYSFCVSLYEALHGVRPFEGTTTEQREAGIAPPFEPAPSHGPLPRVPQWLRRLLTRGMAPDPDDRFASMDALLTEIRVALRRRQRIPLVAAALGLTAVGVAVGQSLPTTADCSGGDERLAGAWDDQRRQQVRTAILGTELSYAADTWERVESRLDEVASAWIDKHTEICEATRVHRAQTEAIMGLRMGCLDRRRTELRATVDVLAQADPRTVEKAARLTSKLSGLTRCDDVEALQALVSPPEDPEVAEQVELERARLEDARVLADIGNHDGSETIAQAVIDRAETLGYGPLTAEAARRRGIARIGAGAYEAAAEDLERSFLLALQHGDVALQLAAASSLAMTMGNDLGEPQRGRDWGSIAEALAQRAEATDGERTMVYQSLGALALRQGALDEALDHYQRCLAFEERTQPPDDVSLGRTLANVAVVLLRQGKLDDAQAHVERAVALGERALGPRHPQLTVTLGTQAFVQWRQGRLDEAVSQYQRILSIQQDALGLDHPSVGGTLNNIGSIMLDQGRAAEGLTHLRRALAAKERALGPEHVQLASTLKNIGRVLIGQAQLSEASAVLERALAIEQRALGPEHFDLADTLNTLAVLRVEQDRGDDAAALLMRALSIIEQTQGSSHPALSNPLINLGNLRQAEGRLDEATAHYQRALSIDEEVLGPRHPHLTQPLIGLAQLALGRAEHASAREYAERAVTILESGEAPPVDLAKAQVLLARALWPEPAMRSRVDALVERARATLEEHREQHQDELDELERWLAER